MCIASHQRRLLNHTHVLKLLYSFSILLYIKLILFYEASTFFYLFQRQLRGHIKINLLNSKVLQVYANLQFSKNLPSSFSLIKHDPHHHQNFNYHIFNHLLVEFISTIIILIQVNFIVNQMNFIHYEFILIHLRFSFCLLELFDLGNKTLLKF